MAARIESPWSMNADALLGKLDSTRSGLSDADARKRLAEYGQNDVPRKGRRRA
ncbi:MAG: cation-transporting P-type ATPase [archaeon]